MSPKSPWICSGLRPAKRWVRPRLKGGVKLVCQGLHNRLQKPGTALQEQCAERYFQFAQRLLLWSLVEKLLDQSRGFLAESRLEFGAFFFEPGRSCCARVMATVVSTKSSASASNCLRPWMACSSARALS
jgi:hypothetical protein